MDIDEIMNRAMGKVDKAMDGVDKSMDKMDRVLDKKFNKFDEKMFNFDSRMNNAKVHIEKTFLNPFKIVLLAFKLFIFILLFVVGWYIMGAFMDYTKDKEYAPKPLSPPTIEQKTTVDPDPFKKL